MQSTQQSHNGQWFLQNGTAIRLSMNQGPRRLQVQSGRVWMTMDKPTQHATADIWLEAGQSHYLAPGEHAVLEAWPSAEFALLEPPPVASKSRLWSRAIFAAVRAWLPSRQRACQPS